MRLLYLLISIAAVFLILSIRLTSPQVSMEEGDIAGEDVYYTGETTTYDSEVATEEARNAAAASVTPIYIIDETVEETLLEEINSYFAALSRVAVNYDAWDSQAHDELRTKIPGNYTDQTLAAMLSMSATERSALAESFQQMISRVYSAGVREEEVAQAQQEIAIAIGSSTISGESESFLKGMLEGMNLTYNETYDAVGTAAAVEEAKAAVPMVQKTVRTGERIVSRGSYVTAAQIEALQALGLRSEKAQITPYIGLAILVALLMTLFYFYLRTYQRRIYLRRSSMMLLGVVMILILLLCKLIVLFTIDTTTQTGTSTVIGYLLPVAAASMLLTVLLNRDTAIVATVILSVYVGIVMDRGYELCPDSTDLRLHRCDLRSPAESAQPVRQRQCVYYPRGSGHHRQLGADLGAGPTHGPDLNGIRPSERFAIRHSDHGPAALSGKWLRRHHRHPAAGAIQL